MKIVIASGYFNPLHTGHIKYLSSAKSLGDNLIVIVNNDKQVTLKGSTPFMKEYDRWVVVDSLRFVDYTFLSMDEDRTVRETISWVIDIFKGKGNTFIFAKGGDSTPENTPEKDIIEVVYGVGGDKVQSSSTLIANATK